MCDACEVLKDEVKYLREQNKELTETLTALLKPKPVIISEPTELEPLGAKGMMWSRRRAIIEAADRAEAALKQNSKLAAVPDPIVVAETAKLEQELGIEEPSISQA